MSGSYAVGTNALNFTAGGAGAAGTGAFSIVALVQPGAGNNNAGFVGLYASTTLTRAIFEDTNHLYSANDFSSGYGTLTQGSWYVVAITKPSASAFFRYHYWAYNATPSGTFSHGTSVGSANQGNGSTITQIRIGANAIAANGLIALVGVWNSELTDGQIDTLVSTQAAAWTALSPTELISLENWNGTSGSATLVGTSAFSSTTGTVSSGANPPSFTFSSSGTVAGAVSFGAAPTLSAAAFLNQAAAVSFGAAPTLAAAATLVQPAAVSFGAAPTLTPATTRVQPATASFGAAPTLTAAATRVQPAIASFGAAPTLVAAALRDQPATVAFGAAPTLSAGAGGVLVGSVSFGSAPTLTAAAVPSKLGTVAFGSAPTLTAAGTVATAAAVAFGVAPALTLAATLQRFAAVAFGSAPTLSAAAQLGPVLPYQTAVLTPGARAATILTSGSALAVLTPGATGPATLIASSA